MEKSGVDPKLTICKIAVLPIKLYPLYYSIIIIITNPTGIWTQDWNIEKVLS